MDSCLRSKCVHHWTIGKSTHLDSLYFFSKWSNALFARRCVICICFSMVFLLQSVGEHTSSTIIMSLQKLHWISTTFSGVKKCLDQSYGEENLTQSSVSFTLTWLECSLSSLFPSHRLNTWNQPLSVSISQFRFSNLCNHPASFINWSHGRRYRWKVLANIKFMIGKSQIYFGSWSISKINHFIVALVHTGIKIGVCILIQFKLISPTLAFHICLSILNFSLFKINELKIKKLRRCLL